jgi:hypothetical protein
MGDTPPRGLLTETELNASAVLVKETEDWFKLRVIFINTPFNRGTRSKKACKCFNQIWAVIQTWTDEPVVEATPSLLLKI